MRVLICGSRYWDDPLPVVAVLSGLLEMEVTNFSSLVVIEGCTPGADSLACHFYDGPCEAPGGGSHASHDHVEHAHFPAQWYTHDREGRTPVPCSCPPEEGRCRPAGPRRNQQMLDEGRPDIVFAFSDNLAESRGTADMVRRARDAGVPTYVIKRAQ